MSTQDTKPRGRRVSAKQLAEFILELRANGVNPVSVNATKQGINVVLRGQNNTNPKTDADQWIEDNA